MTSLDQISRISKLWRTQRKWLMQKDHFIRLLQILFLYAAQEMCSPQIMWRKSFIVKKSWGLSNLNTMLPLPELLRPTSQVATLPIYSGVEDVSHMGHYHPWASATTATSWSLNLHETANLDNVSKTQLRKLQYTWAQLALLWSTKPNKWNRKKIKCCNCN